MRSITACSALTIVNVGGAVREFDLHLCGRQQQYETETAHLTELDHVDANATQYQRQVKIRNKAR
jgi:hypothetical protein